MKLAEVGPVATGVLEDFSKRERAERLFGLEEGTARGPDERRLDQTAGSEPRADGETCF